MDKDVESVFKQRHFFTQFKFEIVERGVEFQEKALFHTVNRKVAFEEIPDEPQEVKISSKVSFWVMIVLWLFFIIVIINQLAGVDVGIDAYYIWGGLGVIASAYYIFNRATYLLYRSGQSSNSIVFLKEKPNKSVFNEYIKKLQNKKHEYLKKTYLTGPIESNSADAIQKLVTLREMGALTNEEFEKLKAEVIKKAEFMGGSTHSTN